MHNKEKRKLEILLELRKYISDDVIVGDIDELCSETIVELKKSSNTYKILLSVTKNSIYIEPKYFLENIENLSIICPKFKSIDEKNQILVNKFFNSYINIFNESTPLDIDPINSNNNYLNLIIKNNYFYTHLELSKNIIFTERKIKYTINLTLYNKFGSKQDFIISSNGDGNFKISVCFESQYVNKPYDQLKDKDFVKYFLSSHQTIFDNDKLDFKIDHKSSFDDIKRALEILEMLNF